MAIPTKRILIPLPDRDFDVTEVAVPWKLLTEAGHLVVFSTERGEVAAADQRLLTFERGPIELGRRGTRTDDTHAFVVQDGRYVSARWPGDAYLFAKRFIDLLRDSGG
jgi:putative intracellular protease/amidase